MSQIIDLTQSEDPRDVVHRAVQALVEGKLVGLSTETNYVVAAYSLQPVAVRQLALHSHADYPPVRTLALKSPLESHDYIREPGHSGQKLIRRCWPGPVTILFKASEDGGVLNSLDPEVQSLLNVDGEIAYRSIGDDVFQAIQRLLPAPLIVSGDFAPDGSSPRTAAELKNSRSHPVDLIIDHGPCRFAAPNTVLRVTDTGWELLREGIYNERSIHKLLSDVFLFICTGNTCRSPMAEALFRKLVADRIGCTEEELPEKGYVSLSAGLSAYPGSAPSPEAVEVLKNQGIDLSGHASRPLTPRLLSQADYVFTMTKSHRDTILWEYPELSHQVALLSREDQDISDPIGGSFDDYACCADDIARHLRAIVEGLKV